MDIRVIPHGFSVCRLKDLSGIDISGEFTFTAATDEEFSLVCPTDAVPPDAECRDDGWSAFAICGTLDFSLIGILADISAILAKEKIGIFAVSTYNTDYIFTKTKNFKNALSALEKCGYTVKSRQHT